MCIDFTDYVMKVIHMQSIFIPLECWSECLMYWLCEFFTAPFNLFFKVFKVTAKYSWPWAMYITAHTTWVQFQSRASSCSSWWLIFESHLVHVSMSHAVTLFLLTRSHGSEYSCKKFIWSPGCRLRKFVTYSAL
jgi:hypothetical protein